MIFKVLLLTVLFFVNPAYGTVDVITTTTDIKWLVEQIGKDKVRVESLLNGSEDPHFIDATPHFVAKVAKADMFCLVGLDLEVGWAPRVLQRSGNAKVQPGGRGYCETGKTVIALDIPTGRIDRSQGDMHAMGNPHYHLSPDALAQGGETVLNTLLGVDPDNSEFYVKNFEALKENLNTIKAKVEKILEPMKDKNFMEYHREFTYFMSTFGLNNTGSIEQVPGVPPSAGQLARVSIKAKQNNVALALASKTSPKNLTDKFNEMSKVPVARLPMSIMKAQKPNTYEQLLTHIAKQIVAKANGK